MSEIAERVLIPMKPDLKARLREQAKVERRSMSEIVRYAVEQYLARA